MVIAAALTSKIRLFHQLNRKLCCKQQLLINKDRITINMHWQLQIAIITKTRIIQLIAGSLYFHQRQPIADSLHMVVVAQTWLLILDSSKLSPIKLEVEESLTKYSDQPLVDPQIYNLKVILIKTKLVMQSILLTCFNSKIQHQTSTRTLKALQHFKHSITPDKQLQEQLRILSISSIPLKWDSDRTNNKLTVQYS